MTKYNIHNQTDALTIPLKNDYTARINWYILYGWIISPENEETRNDIISYMHNKYLLSKGKMPSKKFAPDYINEYYMFMAFSENYTNGLKHLIKKSKYSALAAGCVIGCLYSMTNHKIKEPGLTKARKVCLKARSHQLIKWKFNNDDYLGDAQDENRDILSYCAALYDFHHNKKMATITTLPGLEEYLKIVLLYQDFCYDFKRSRSHDGIDPYVIKPRSSIEVDKKFKLSNKEPVFSQVFSKEEFSAALKVDR